MLSYIICVAIMYVLVLCEIWDAGGFEKFVSNINLQCEKELLRIRVTPFGMKLILAIILLIAPVSLVTTIIVKLWSVCK